MHTPVPDNAIPFFTVSAGDNPWLDESRMSHETDRTYALYRTFGGDLSTYSGLTYVQKQNLRHWGHAVFFDRKEALRCQRERLIAARDAHLKAADEITDLVDRHTARWGKI